MSATEKTALARAAGGRSPRARSTRLRSRAGDCQWIHTDPHRAAAAPFGGTIAHGYLTLSLIPALLDEVFPLD